MSSARAPRSPACKGDRRAGAAAGLSPVSGGEEFNAAAPSGPAEQPLAEAPSKRNHGNVTIVTARRGAAAWVRRRAFAQAQTKKRLRALSKDSRWRLHFRSTYVSPDLLRCNSGNVVKLKRPLRGIGKVVVQCKMYTVKTWGPAKLRSTSPLDGEIRGCQRT